MTHEHTCIICENIEECDVEDCLLTDDDYMCPECTEAEEDDADRREDFLNDDES